MERMMRAPGKPEYASLEAIKHSLCFWGGLVATDRPDLHNLDTDRDKNTVFEIDTQNEIAMIDEAMQQHSEERGALEALIAAIREEFERDAQVIFYSLTGRQRLQSIMNDALERTRPHFHHAGTIVGKDIDECALCGHDIRHSIHLRTNPA
jgi:hypothetical protein